MSKRFIPACAGNTIYEIINSMVFSVYPRMCGEHGDAVVYASHRAGLSPHVRGTLIRLAPAFCHDRFIPACAGNTVRPLVLKACQTVYPRMCGEHTNHNPLFKLNFIGLSISTKRLAIKHPNQRALTL